MFSRAPVITWGRVARLGHGEDTGTSAIASGLSGTDVTGRSFDPLGDSYRVHSRRNSTRAQVPSLSSVISHVLVGQLRQTIAAPPQLLATG